MDLLAQLLTCLRLFSRLPIPTTRREADIASAGLAQATAMVPVAGAIIGLVPALVLVVAQAAGLQPGLAAPLALAGLLAATGALHEDGLADCADGFGGGQTRARKLDIMRDSRIGTFGACALALSLYSRALAIGEIAAHGPWLGAAIVVVTASLSRTACLLPLLLLPPARPDGLGVAAGRPTGLDVATAFVVAVGLSLGALFFGASLPRLCVAIVGGVIGALAVCGLAWRQIEGQTGDVAGLVQQIAEIAVLLVFASG